MGTVERLIDYTADIWVALKGIASEFDAWNAQPHAGLIYVQGALSVMTTPETPTDIPANDVPARVDWFDKLGNPVPKSSTTTTWTVEDDTGAPSAAVSVNPTLDMDTNEETAVLVFAASSGLFRLVATTTGATGTIHARSALYNIVPGAPTTATITVG